MPNYPEITPEMLAEFEANSSFNLTAPDNARKQKVKNKVSGVEEQHERWNESAQIVDVTALASISNAGIAQDVYTVRFEVTATKGSGKNVGRKIRFQGRVNAAAWPNGNKEDGQYKMSNGTMSRIVQLVKAVGYDVKAGLTSAQMAAYFPEGGGSPLIGKQVYLECHKFESDRSAEGWETEANAFFPLKVVAPSAEV